MTAGLAQFSEYGHDDMLEFPATTPLPDDEEPQQPTPSHNPGQGRTQGRSPLSVEDKVYQGLIAELDHAHAVEVEVLMAGNTRCAATLQAHSDHLFQSSSESGYRVKMGSWLMFLRIAHPTASTAVADLQQVVWPPAVDAWKSFMLAARCQISSYGSFVNAMVNVCWVANRYFSAKLHVPASSLDPRQLYAQEHSNIMGLIRREYGTTVRQTEAITIREALNAPHYADVLSVRGVAMVAAFTMGALLGGRRPRSLTAVRLADLKITVGACPVGGREVMVPQLQVTFTDEKFMDLQGPRKASDKPSRASYVDHIWSSPAYWVYRLLAMRGAFCSFDPILTATAGATIEIKTEWLQHFLFCEVTSNWWIDTAPSSTGAISDWNRALLLRMGSKPRGFSAHRSGFVSRTCILGIMHNKGTELPPGLMDMMVRAGGWQAVTGAKTVLRVYARQVIDEHLDVYSMSLGIDSSPVDWARKIALYKGEAVFPDKPVVDLGRGNDGLQFRMLTWRCPMWQSHLAALNHACSSIVHAAMFDQRIMHVKGYKELRHAFSDCKQHAAYRDSAVVTTLQRLSTERPKVWRACVCAIGQKCLYSFVNNPVLSCTDRSGYRKHLAEVQIGFVGLAGILVTSRPADLLWDHNYAFAWAGTSNMVHL